MSLCIDTGVFYALHDRDAPRHSSACDAIEVVSSGEYGRLFTSEYVYDETVTLVRQRTGRFGAAKRAGDRILVSIRFRTRSNCSTLLNRCWIERSTRSNGTMVTR